MADTVDEGSTRPYYEVATAATVFVAGVKDDQTARRIVMDRAKLGSALHCHALAVSVQSRMPSQPKEKAKP